MAEDTKVEKVVENVTMTDGRVVAFAGKRKMQKTTMIDGTVVEVRLDFRNGETRTFLIPAAMRLQFAGHGAEQKLGDEISGLVEVEDCVLAIDKLLTRLNAGEWGVTRESGSMAGTSILIRALVEFSGKSLEDTKIYLANKTQAEKLALRNNVRIKPIVDRLEAEKSAKKTGPAIDTDAMLDELA